MIPNYFRLFGIVIIILYFNLNYNVVRLHERLKYFELH